MALRRVSITLLIQLYRFIPSAKSPLVTLTLRIALSLGIIPAVPPFINEPLTAETRISALQPHEMVILDLFPFLSLLLLLLRLHPLPLPPLIQPIAKTRT